MKCPVVECIDVTKCFETVPAVDKVSFALQQGEILSILGPSGCGKTTLLRLIAGFYNLDGGEIRLRGQGVSTQNIHVPPEHRNVGMVFQEYALFPHLTVAENVLFGLTKLTETDRRNRLAEILDMVKLTGFKNRYPHELSGGQRQRVALARSLAPRPLTVLLDEPFSNIEAALRRDIRNDVKRILREAAITAIFVTHDRDEAFVLGDRVAAMRSGHIDQIGIPDDVYHAPATKFVAEISGRCDFLSGVVRNDVVVTEIGEFTYASISEEYQIGSQVDLLVRLDDFRLVPARQGNSIIVSREFFGDEIIMLVETPSGDFLRCRCHHSSTLTVGTRVSLCQNTESPFVAFPRLSVG